MKTAFITGVSGQDGSFLAKLLLEKGYHVIGGSRRLSVPNYSNLNKLGIYDDIEVIDFELTDQYRIFEIISKYKPDEVYNLAANSFVSSSFVTPNEILKMDGEAVLNMLEAIRIFSPSSKFYQASTSEMFGKVQQIPQTEVTPFYPRSPYGVAKLYAHWSVVNHRESYDLFAASGILFNHESEFRGPEFVTRKISMHAATWINNKKGKLLEIGNLNSKRDWGYAKEYVEGMWKMLQTDVPDTYVLATGKTSSVRDFVKLAFEEVGRELEFQNQESEEVGIDKITSEVLVKVNPKYYRPAEVEILEGNSEKAFRELNWKAKTDLKELVRIMVKNDIELFESNTQVDFAK